MSATSPSIPVASLPRQLTYASEEYSIRSWVLTTDHKRVGGLFLVTTTLMMALGGAFALVLRIEHLTPERTIVDALAYNRLFTLHGIVMVFLFLIPSIPPSSANFMVQT